MMKKLIQPNENKLTIAREMKARADSGAVDAETAELLRIGAKMLKEMVFFCAIRSNLRKLNRR